MPFVALVLSWAALILGIVVVWHSEAKSWRIAGLFACILSFPYAFYTGVTLLLAAFGKSD
jgi:hypothetical protein